MEKTITIIGSGFSALAASCYLAKEGFEVTILEKNNTVGGRARQFSKEGFTFDIGPTWYWMPDVFEKFFADFGKKPSDYYHLDKLNPAYEVYFDKVDSIKIPDNLADILFIFEKEEKGSAKHLNDFLVNAKHNYDVAIKDLVYRPGISITELITPVTIKKVNQFFSSIRTTVRKKIKNHRLQQIMEFPVLFLGAKPSNTPSFYSFMNYADFGLGTWHPKGGMYEVVKAMVALATELGVKFIFDCDVTSINVNLGEAKSVSAITTTNGQPTTINFNADIVVGGADYNFIETKLLPENCRTYSNEYWNKRVMAPSCLLYYVGLNKKLDQVLHHSLFFDTDFGVHGKEIYTKPVWPSDPLFYVSVPSVTDKTVAPEGHENLFFLIPVAAGLEGDTEALRDRYFDTIVERFEKRIGQSVKENIIYKKSYSVSNFVHDYNSFKGNAYGLANTLMQTAFLKPKMRSKKVKNLFYTGQLTVPGPGVPPAIISGQIISKEIVRQIKKKIL